MAVTRYRIRYVEDPDTVVMVTVSAGDRIRSAADIRSLGADAVGEQIPRMLFMAAKRNDLPHTEGDFESWADHVAEYDMELTEQHLTEMLAAGRDPDEVERMRALIEPPTAGERTGESPAAPGSSPASPSAPDSL